jgi:hypothetical protein
MELGYRSPLVELFRRGEAPRDVRILAARGALAPRAHEQLELLVLLSGDRDAAVAAAADQTIARLPLGPLSAFLSGPSVSHEVREFFAARGVVPDASARAESSELPIDVDGPLSDVTLEEDHVENRDAGHGADDVAAGRLPITALPVTDRVKLAMRGSREQRSFLVRDANRLVATAVLSSPKVTESEIEGFARMGNVSDDVLRIIGSNRAWTKSYGVVSALVHNPKTPVSIAMTLANRLNARDIKMLAVDRNVPEAIRLVARKYAAAAASRQK